MFTRRDFGKIAVAATPLAMAYAVPSDVSALRPGVTTTSFHDIPHVPSKDNVDEILRAFSIVKVGEIELSALDAQAAPPPPGLPPPPPPGAYGGPITGLTPAEMAARNKAMRETLRVWRLQDQTARFAATKAKFNSAGMSIYSYRVDYDDQFTEAEMNATLDQAKALGASVVTASASLTTAAQLAPLVEKRGMLLSIQNADKGLTTPADFQKFLALSKAMRISLDIGNFTAANQESVAFIQENHDRITHLIVKDRLRNGGSNERFGDGDTPIKQVMTLLRSKNYDIRVFADYQYVGLGTASEELKKCLAYLEAKA